MRSDADMFRQVIAFVAGFLTQMNTGEHGQARWCDLSDFAQDLDPEHGKNGYARFAVKITRLLSSRRKTGLVLKICAGVLPKSIRAPA